MTTTEDILNEITAYPKSAFAILKHKAQIAGPMYDLDLPIGQILAHDYSKFSPSIFPAYSQFFFTKETPEKRKAFFQAMHKHFESEPHHWEKAPEEWGAPANKPMINKLESVADTYAAFKRKATGDFPDFKTWYTENKDKFVAPDVQTIVNERLNLIKSAKLMSRYYA
jgi:hypothetical protein